MMRIDVTVAEEAALETLQRAGPCGIDDLVIQLPYLSWGEVFLAVDQMSRDGRLLIHRRLLLRPPGSSSYQITLPSELTSPHSPSRQNEARP